MTEYLADQRDRYVLAQEIAASVMSKVMPCQMRQRRFIEQGSEYSLLEVLIRVLVAFGCAEHQFSRIPSWYPHLYFTMLGANAYKSFHQTLVNGY